MMLPRYPLKWFGSSHCDTTRVVLVPALVEGELSLLWYRADLDLRVVLMLDFWRQLFG